MQTSHWDFSTSHAGQLRMSERPLPERRTKANRGNRQSGLAILYTTARRLPFCSAIAAAAIWAVARLLPEYIRWTVAAWSAGLLALALALGSAAVSWSVTRWQLTDLRLSISSGVLTRREVTIHRSAILSADMVSTPFTALFRCSRLYIRTTQRGDRRPDALLMSTRDAVILSGRLMPEQPPVPDSDTLPDCHRNTHRFRADRGSLLMAAVGGEGLAAFCSAAASAFSLLRDSVGVALGEQVSMILRSRGAATAAFAVLAGAWLLKGGHTLLTHAGMNYTRTDRLLVISRGTISRRSLRLRNDGICALDRRRSLPSAFFRRESASLLMSGGQRYDLLPPVDNRRSRIEAAAIIPRGRPVCAVSPMLSSLAYAAGRLAACLSVLPLITVLRRLIPSWNGTIIAAGTTALILLLWRAVSTAACAPCAGMTLFTDCVELTGVRRLTIHTLRIFRPSAGLIRITRSPLNRLSGRCSVRIVPRGGNAGSSLSCIKLPFDRAMAACERLV